MTELKLNLGCGDRKLPGYVNVDKYDTFAPDMVVDLEATPWPFATDGVAEIRLIHVLEHLGQTTAVFLDIMKEMYRVCRNGARIVIKVPHPRSDGFLGDPTHVRPVTPAVLSLFSKEANRVFIERGWPNTRLAMQLDVDFRTVSVDHRLTEIWYRKLQSGAITQDGLNEAAAIYNNVVDEISIELEVVKPDAGRR
ncbi:class I SAM-dependent methyltransferase [Azospirillum sp. ST 5-10]|uniref:class I SAM-dependent methyltransferase n=1 Tax=unclassified Azospirillum TaxID=2630922 RepID=UPI003F4A1167